MDNRKYSYKEIVSAGKYMYLCSMVHNDMKSQTSGKCFNSIVRQYVLLIKSGNTNAKRVLDGFIEMCKDEADGGKDISRWKKLFAEYREWYDERGMA